MLKIGSTDWVYFYKKRIFFLMRSRRYNLFLDWRPRSNRARIYRWLSRRIGRDRERVRRTLR